MPLTQLGRIVYSERLVVLGSLLSFVAAGAAAGESSVGAKLVSGGIVTNGDFEVPDAMPGPNQYWVTYFTEETFGGWTVSKGSVDHKGILLQAARGVQSVDLTGSSAGGIYQDLPTEAGCDYLLRFHMSGNPGDGTGAAARSFEVWWGDSLLDTLTVDMAGRTPEDMQWELVVYERLTAATATTRLEFISKTPGIFGPMIDFVAVVPLGDVDVAQLTDSEAEECESCCGVNPRHPIVYPDGTQVAFASTGDLDGSVGNGERNLELFRYDLETELILQDSQTGEGFTVPYDYVGDRIAFVSTSPEMGSNADGNADLFCVEMPGAVLTQVSDTMGPAAITHGDGACPLAWFLESEEGTLANIHADLSANGVYVVWASNRNIPSLGFPSGNNADENYEVYRRNLNTGEVVQLTDSTGGDGESQAAAAHLWPRVSADGARTVFLSNRPWGGASIAEGRYGLFVMEGATVQRVTTADLEVERPFPGFGMDSGGTRVVFASDADLTGGNADGNSEIYSYDLDTQEVKQLTSTLLSTTGEPVRNHRPILSGDGLKVAFLSNAAFESVDGDGSEDLWVYHFERDLQYAQDFIQVTDVGATPEATEGRAHWLDWHHFGREGAHLVWTANADLTGGNPSNEYELYLATFEWQLKTVLEDVNNDDAINAIDVQLVINAALGLPTTFNCDVNVDGAVNAVDVQLVVNSALGL